MTRDTHHHIDDMSHPASPALLRVLLVLAVALALLAALGVGRVAADTGASSSLDGAEQYAESSDGGGKKGDGG